MRQQVAHDTLRVSGTSTRRGLAPLELVFCLPVLLFIMALMVNFSTSTCWKVRASSAARYGMYRDRMDWRGGGDPAPPDWPQNARIGRTGAAPLSNINSVWMRPEIDHPFAHGPLITNQGPYPNSGNASSGRIAVYSRNNLTMANGPSAGTSDIRRTMPLLPSLRQLHYDLRHPLLDNRWQFYNMGYGWNGARRAKGWYNFENDPEWAQQLARFRQADQMIRTYPQRESLAVLDRDPEFPAWYSSLNNYMDFYPRISGGCNDDVQSVRQGPVQTVLNDILGQRGGGRGGFATRMTNAFIRMYEEQIATLQAQQPVNQGEVTRIQTLIDQLQQFGNGILY